MVKEKVESSTIALHWMHKLNTAHLILLCIGIQSVWRCTMHKKHRHTHTNVCIQKERERKRARERDEDRCELDGNIFPKENEQYGIKWGKSQQNYYRNLLSNLVCMSDIYVPQKKHTHTQTLELLHTRTIVHAKPKQQKNEHRAPHPPKRSIIKCDADDVHSLS